VSLVAAEMAAAWCDCLESHIRRVYQASFDADIEPARRLADRIRKGEVPSPFTVRWVSKRDWSGLATGGDVERAVATLERLDWIRGVERPAGEHGGRPTVDDYIHSTLIPKPETGGES
jgi:hypothetical protein